MRVLHVTEAFGGGVASAIQSFAQALPERESDLLYVEREGAPTTAFGAVRRVKRNPLALATALRDLVRSSRYDVVHVHSTWAGAVVRLSLSRRRVPIVYSPHCFAFQRTDLPHVARVGLWCVEFMLTRNTSAVFACSPNEANRARRMAPRWVTWIPNIARGDLRPLSGEGEPGGTIFTVGRISTQKDPTYFAAVAALVRERDPAVSCVWVGDGDSQSRAHLEASGVRVTGWIPEEDVLGGLGDRPVYMHTAAWEGFPISIVQAAAAGIPIVARAGPHFEGITFGQVVSSPREASDALMRILGDSDARASCVRLGRQLLETCNQDRQALDLAAGYAKVVARGEP